MLRANAYKCREDETRNKGAFHVGGHPLGLEMVLDLADQAAL